MTKTTPPILLLTLSIGCFCDDLSKPVYKYRYETEDVMKTAASTIPIRGYHVVEGGYYPVGELGLGVGGGIGGLGVGNIGGGELIGGYGGQFVGKIAPVGLVGMGPVGMGSVGGAGIGGAGLIRPIAYEGSGLGHGGLGYVGGGGVGLNAGYSGVGPGLAGVGTGLGGARFVGTGGGIGSAGVGLGGAGVGLSGVGHHGYGGEAVEKEEFSEGKKKHNDEHFEKKEGKQGEEINHGQTGISKGEVVVKDVKGDSGYYKNVDEEKQIYEDGKEYHGGQHFNKEGKNSEEKTIKQGHKKGHKIKSFKNSHHKDESGKTEEYYDEDHDEGGNYAFNGASGTFGEKGASAFKGGKEEGKYKEEEAKKEGHYQNENLLDKANANEGKYGENKYAGQQAVFANKNGAEDQSLLGHQEASKFYKHQPFIVPFHH